MDPRQANAHGAFACTPPPKLRRRPCDAPAVMFEMVQHASFLMLFLCVPISSCSRHGSAPQFIMTWVCMSLPVTMLPTVRSAGTSTAGEWCLAGVGAGAAGA